MVAPLALEAETVITEEDNYRTLPMTKNGEHAVDRMNFSWSFGSLRSHRYLPEMTRVPVSVSIHKCYVQGGLVWSQGIGG